MNSHSTRRGSNTIFEDPGTRHAGHATGRRQRRSWLRAGAMVLLMVAPLALSCQQLDPNLASGRVTNSSGGSGGSVSIGESGGSGVPAASGGASGGSLPDGGADVAVVPVTCSARRARAFKVLSTNCAFCHQAPQNASYPNNFDFILDLAQLTSRDSPSSSTTLRLKYVVKGDPSHSYIYQRVASKPPSMPPAFRTQQPSADDIQALGDWISSCIDDSDSPTGWGDTSGGGGAGGSGAGGSSAPGLTACGPANVCPNGGCCVFSQCRPNGTTCGSLPNPIAGEADLAGLPGSCNLGSCLNQAGLSCGKVDEPCCDFNSCTASQSSCLITDMTKCSACGGTGQPCCKPNGCLDGRACINGGVGRVGTCQLCGDVGQPCCGTGIAALQTCNGTLTCVSVTGMGNLCTSSGAGGVGGSGGAGGASGAGGGGGR